MPVEDVNEGNALFRVRFLNESSNIADVTYFLGYQSHADIIEIGFQWNNGLSSWVQLIPNVG
jgi:hypothetical protein